ncbi:MAG: GTPase Era [Acholeplasmataceae bacterium]|jgi:GTP-binding protein Era|nr:GTPase Era [Acholeplasmataceae bacterium]MDD4204064.1 GTPase Era [Acholeplasmataceae bacterium]MDD4468952.1 GTPase Era [Acholeplasmataceae bacterium]MDD4824036.1 GTPase Era [Acholeplasmataceae bacterium]MDY0316308.1 GTPase Era [Acholeplasmatales bacterium]
MSNFKSGFVGIIGRANVGKSTLLNTLIGEKVAITSYQPQTTRTQILGVKTLADAQIIFMDTPGIHKPKHALGSFLDEQAISAISSVDVILYMVDSEYSFAQDFVIRHFKETKTPVFLVINKIDLLKSKIEIDKIILSYMDKHDFKGIYPISSKTSQNIEYLLQDIIEELPLGELLYDESVKTPQTDFERMAELIREKVLYHTKEEIPHSVAVVIEHAGYEHNLYVVYATIVVERDSQKNILIGKQGSMLKVIGSEARKDINETLETQIHLNLWVKVIKDWRNRPQDLKGLGYDL